MLAEDKLNFCLDNQYFISTTQNMFNSFNEYLNEISYADFVCRYIFSRKNSIVISPEEKWIISDSFVVSYDGITSKLLMKAED